MFISRFGLVALSSEEKKINMDRQDKQNDKNQLEDLRFQI
jgi:hypothetical protein